VKRERGNAHRDIKGEKESFERARKGREKEREREKGEAGKLRALGNKTRHSKVQEERNNHCSYI